MGRRGMVVSANPLASHAGLQMLAAGGNAVDAAIAAAVAITVVEPYHSSIGGVGIAVITLPGGETRTLNFLGCSPLAARPEGFTEKTRDVGVLAPMVPGNVAGWARIHDEYGSLPLAKVLEPAIELAERGSPVTIFDYVQSTKSIDRITPFPESVRTYLKNGRPYKPGESFSQPQLAASLRMLAADGWMSFYEGRIGRAMSKFLADRGGIITADDLRNYPGTLKWQTPVSAHYRGHEFRTPPPPSSAVQILQTLRILESFDLKAMDPLGPDYIGLVAEAIRLARMDAATHIADPLFVDVPLDWMLSDGRIAELRGVVSRRVKAALGKAGRGKAARSSASGRGRRGGAAAGRIRRAGTAPEQSTTHLGAADGSGLAVNITQTIGGGYGSGVVVGDTGIVLNNGHFWCTRITGNHKVIASNERRASPSSPLHTFPADGPPVRPTHSFGIDCLGPAHATRRGRLAFIIGTPGSYGIPQTTAQMILGLVEFGRTIQDAIAAPRFRWKDDVGDPLPPAVILLEGRYPNAVRKALASRGYRLEILEDWSMVVGGGQGVLFREDGWMQGGGDPRRNSYALGW